MRRHEFIPLPQLLPNGASMGCKYCGAKDIDNKPGCTPVENGNFYDSIFNILVCFFSWILNQMVIY